MKDTQSLGPIQQIIFNCLVKIEFERQTIDPIGHVIHSMPCTPCFEHVGWLWNEGPARLLIKNSLPRLQFLCLFASFLRFVCESWGPQGISICGVEPSAPSCSPSFRKLKRLWLFLGSARGCSRGKFRGIAVKIVGEILTRIPKCLNF